MTVPFIKANKIEILDSSGQQRIELSLGNSDTNNIFTEPAIILYDSLGKIRAVYGLEERGTGALSFWSEDDLSEIVVTNSKRWGIDKPNFLRRPNNDDNVEAVFKD